MTSVTPRRLIVGITGASGSHIRHPAARAPARRRRRVASDPQPLGRTNAGARTTVLGRAGAALATAVYAANDQGAAVERIVPHDGHDRPAVQRQDARRDRPRHRRQPDPARADVVMKERRRLVLCVRESPFHEIHLRNMLRLTRMGADHRPSASGLLLAAADPRPGRSHRHAHARPVWHPHRRRVALGGRDGSRAPGYARMAVPAVRRKKKRRVSRAERLRRSDPCPSSRSSTSSPARPSARCRLPGRRRRRRRRPARPAGVSRLGGRPPTGVAHPAAPAELIDVPREMFTTPIAREAGKARKHAAGEVARSIETFTFAAEEAKRIHGETVPMDASAFGNNASASTSARRSASCRPSRRSTSR